MSAKAFVTFASGASGVAIVVAAVSVIVMLTDINNFYDDAISELDEFKVSFIIFTIRVFQPCYHNFSGIRQ